MAGNLADNPPPPNWDGTIEKAPVVQQPKPVQNQDQTKPQNQNQQDQNQPINPQKGMEEDEKWMGLPPSPQMDKSGKKG